MSRFAAGFEAGGVGRSKRYSKESRTEASRTFRIWREEAWAMAIRRASVGDGKAGFFRMDLGASPMEIDMVAVFVL